MAGRAVKKSPRAALRGGLFLLLVSISLPTVAASGISLKCDAAPVKPADLTAATAVPAEPAGDHDRLRVLKSEGDVRNLATGSDLGSMIESDFEKDSALSALEQQEFRSAALADALERRRRGRIDNSDEDIEAPGTAPAIDTALPGVGDAESLLYRREMYRTDI